MQPPLYSIENLTHSYNGRPALQVDALTITRASIVGLMGPNGSGKSTLLNILGFIHAPTLGRLLFKGQPAKPFSRAVRFQVTILPQEPYLMHRSVHGNIVYGLKLRGDRDVSRQKVIEALELVGLPGEQFAGRQWYELSGGEAQRVALAARLILRPEVLILDEPTASVDAASVERIKEASLRAREDWGTTLVIASHDQEWLQEVCDETLFMFQGRVLGTGRGNIVFGPWQAAQNGRLVRTLRDGQRFLAYAPIQNSNNAVAVVDPDELALCLTREEVPAQREFLHGTITRLALEKLDGDIVATLVMDGLTLTARLKASTVLNANLYPGRQVFLHYDPAKIRWVER